MAVKVWGWLPRICSTISFLCWSNLGPSDPFILTRHIQNKTKQKTDPHTFQTYVLNIRESGNLHMLESARTALLNYWNLESRNFEISKFASLKLWNFEVCWIYNNTYNIWAKNLIIDRLSMVSGSCLMAHGSRGPRGRWPPSHWPPWTMSHEPWTINH